MAEVVTQIIQSSQAIELVVESAVLYPDDGTRGAAAPLAQA